MKRNFLLIILTFLSATGFSQEENAVPAGSNLEQQLETLAEQQDGETEDDSYLQKLVELRRNRLNLNSADNNDLRQTGMISEIQLQNFIKYRQLLGALISIYELQAVPGWNVETIKKVLPYVFVGNVLSFRSNLQQRLAGGQSSLLIRAQQTIEKSNGYLRPDSISNRYPGSPQRLYLRYKYRYKNLLEYGVTADKDAGEQFFKGNEKQGFDFYSFHFFIRKAGAVKALALGDFTVNLGQGLIQWQSLAFKKSAEITGVKRQADILQPYNSAGEFNFLRGAGITVGGKHVDATAFASLRHLDATFNNDTTIANHDFVSSILSSGYHRTVNEIAKKNSISQTSFGGNVSYNKNSFHIGANSVAFSYSVPLIRNMRFYNQYAIQGKTWFNYSVDYSYTFRNFHFFGEAAADKNNSKAFISGVLASLDEKVDVSLLYRNIQKSYGSLYGNAFTENTLPVNEKGLFTGIGIRPVRSLTINAYADVFSFPWLRYRTDAPSHGSEYLVQLTYKPNKRLEAYTRFKSENKALNLPGLNLATAEIAIRPLLNWRNQFNYQLTKELSLHNRIEFLWFDQQEKERRQHGLLLYTDGRYKPFNKAFSINGRLQYFKTDAFESRIYSFESDVLYSYTIPGFIGKGFHYYCNVNYDVTKKLSVWARFSQTIYSNKSSIGSGLDKIEGNKRSEVKLQALYNF